MNLPVISITTATSELSYLLTRREPSMSATALSTSPLDKMDRGWGLRSAVILKCTSPREASKRLHLTKGQPILETLALFRSYRIKCHRKISFTSTVFQPEGQEQHRRNNIMSRCLLRLQLLQVGSEARGNGFKCKV